MDGERLLLQGEPRTLQVSRSWINDVAWSPTGLQLAFVAHDGLLHVAAFAPNGTALPVVKVREGSASVFLATRSEV